MEEKISRIKIMSVVMLLLISIFSTVSISAVETEVSSVGLNSYVEISNWTDLNNIRYDLNGDYVLIKDLDENTEGYDDHVSETAITEANERFGAGGNAAGTQFSVYHTPIEEVVKVIDTADDLEVAFNVVSYEDGIVEIEESTDGYAWIIYRASGPGWNPIGIDSNAHLYGSPFTGTFDGQGHQIKDLFINRPTELCTGLFGSAGDYYNRAVLKNVGLEDVNVTGEGMVGSLAGTFMHSDGSGESYVENTYVTGEVNTNDFRSGGLIGSLNGAFGSVAGGMIRDSYAMVNVTSTSYDIGGLVGYMMNYASVNNSYSIGGVIGSFNEGGLVGYVSGGTVSNSYWDIQTSGTTYSAGGTGLTTDEMTGYSAQENMTSFDFIDTWGILDGSQKFLKEDGYPILQGLDRLNQLRSQNIDLYAEGDGSESDPFQIADWTHLFNIRENMTAHFNMINDLDETTEGYDEIVDTTEGWDPIGGWDSSEGYTYFTGSFDGQNKNISDLFINRPTESFVGLFGYVDGGAILNVTLKNINITGDDRTGSLIGRNDFGSVYNSSASGKVAGGYVVGGLVAMNQGTIKQSFASVDVVSESSQTSSEAGGLVGANHDTIKDCYATGNVTGNKERVGGLAGNNGASITSSYSIGKVSGDSARVGGHIGYDYGTVTDSYWDVFTSNHFFSAAGTGLPTADMTGNSAKENMTGFDFTNIWNIFDNGTHVSYPYLRNNMQEPGLQPSADIRDGFENGDGSASDPYLIENWYHLENVNLDLSANYTVMNELNETTEGYHDVASELAHGRSGFDPIGGSTWSGPFFTGHFDGQGYQIKNIFINRSSSDLLGLFAYIGEDGSVSNTSVVDVNITGDSYLGALAGWSDGTVIDSWSSGDIIGGGTDDVGGLIGGSMGIIERCYSTANVTGHSYIGGLVGGIYSYPNTAFINESYATGTVKSDNQYAGGLVGYHDGVINISYATGDVNGSSDVGGLVGYIDGVVNNSYATGDVNGSSDVGGLLGGSNGVINNCYAAGYVNASSYVGGLIGYSSGTESSSYWDMETTDQSTSSGSATGLTTGEMKTKSTFTEGGWDFDTVWNIKELDSGFVSYPYLQNNKQDPAPGEEESYLDNVEIVPSDDQTITAGETIDFNATAYNQYGHLITDTDSDFIWQNTDTDGLFTETTGGIYKVKAENNAIESDMINVTVEAAEADSLQVTNDPGTVTAGESFQLTIDVTDVYGNPAVNQALDNFTITSEYDGEVYNEGTIYLDENGQHVATVQAGQVTTASEEHTLTISFNPETEINITVEPAEVDHVEIYPDEYQLVVYTGEHFNFSAAAYDEYGNMITEDDTDFTWENTNGYGLFQEMTVDHFYVNATYDGVTSDTVIVTVIEGAAPSLEITAPSEAVEELTYDEEFTIEGNTNADMLWINEVEVDVDGTGSFNQSFLLDEGLNVFYVTAEDEVGNRAVVEVYALYLPQIQEMQLRIDDLEIEIDANRAAIEELENLTKQLEIDVSALETELSVQVTELEQDLDENVTALENAILENRADLINIIDSNINYIDDELASINADISDIYIELEDYVTFEEFVEGLEDYLTYQEINDLLEDYVKNGDLPGILENYLTEDEIEEMIDGLNNRQETIDVEQDDDISSSKNLGIVGVIIALLALIIAIFAVAKRGGKDTFEEETTDEDTFEEGTTDEDTFEEETTDEDTFEDTEDVSEEPEE
ncbi:MAG: GLUG motif-containing protein [Thermoplasmatota archaeon]